MATGYGDNRNEPYGFRSAMNRNNSSDDYSKKTNSNTIDREDITLEVVNDFKRIVQDKIQRGNQLKEPIVALEVFKIRSEKFPDQCNFAQWKKDISRDIPNCPDSILRVSMAYGNNPHEIKSILQTKINNMNSTDLSLDNIFVPLRNLKKDLENNRQPNLLRAVRKIDQHDRNRAARLFYSEALHFASNLKEYTFADAQNAVEGIRQTDSESTDPTVLIPIVKTFREVDEIREHLENSSKPTRPSNQSSTKASRFSDDDDRTNSITKNTPSNNDNSGFRYKSSSNVLEDSSQSSTKTSRFPDDDRTNSITKNTPSNNDNLGFRYKPLPNSFEDSSQSSTKTSRFSDDDRTNSITTNTPSNNTNPGFRYKPLPNPYEDSSQSSNRPRQPDNRSRDEPNQNTSRRFNQDNN